MLRIIRANFLIFFTYLRVSLFFRRAKKNHTLKLQDLLKKQNVSRVIPEETSKRMLAYSLFCRFVLELSALYHSTKETKNEEESAFLLGIMTPLADDLNDDFGLNFEEIERLEGHKDENQILHLLHELNKAFKLDNKQNFQKYYEKLKIAQNDSLKQKSGNNLEFYELMDITERKGAYSFLLYRSIFNSQISENETEILKQVGFLFQLVNDLFDVYKDAQSNTQSTVLNCSSLESFEGRFNAEILQLLLLIYMETEISLRTKEKYVATISTILARGYVCLNQLINLQSNTSIPFEAHKFTREQLICDMEKPRNIWLSYRMSVRLFQKFQHLKFMASFMQPS